MSTQLTILQRHFIQFMLNNGQVTLTKALTFCEKLSPDVNSVATLKGLIIQINREISQQNFKIAPATCEITGEQVLLWLNLKSDAISQQQLGNSALELEYFHGLFQEILMSEGHKMMYPMAINIASTLTATMSRENGERSLTKWIRGGYFVKKKEHVYLGPRTIVEYSSYLRAGMGAICDLCSDLVFVGQDCSACTKMYHIFCLEKYQQNQQTCPSCKANWQSGQNDHLEATSQQDSELSADSDEEN